MQVNITRAELKLLAEAQRHVANSEYRRAVQLPFSKRYDVFAKVAVLRNRANELDNMATTAGLEAA